MRSRKEYFCIKILQRQYSITSPYPVLLERADGNSPALFRESRDTKEELEENIVMWKRGMRELAILNDNVEHGLQNIQL